MLRPVGVVIRDEAFRISLGCGAAGALIVVAARRSAFRVGASSLACLATVAGLAATGRGSTTLYGALVLLAAGGWVTRGRAVAWQLGAAAPGAFVLATAISSDDPSWVRIAAGGE